MDFVEKTAIREAETTMNKTSNLGACDIDPLLVPDVDPTVHQARLQLEQHTSRRLEKLLEFQFLTPPARVAARKILWERAGRTAWPPQ
jgi:hypothetical protein